jgi:hypothetical protein
MMGDENLLPEERLFKAIQQEKKASMQGRKAPGGIAQGGPARRSLGAGIGQSFLKVVRRKIFGKGAEKNGEETKKSFAFLAKWQDIDFIKTFLLTGIDLTIVNRGLVLMIAALAALTIHYVVSNRLTMAGLMSSIARVKFDAARPQAIEAFQPLDYYLNQVRSRDVFNPVAARVERPVVVEQTPPPPKPRLSDMARGLKIVGIALGATPKAMVKDDLTQEVYFLKEGDVIGNTGIAIKAISKDKVLIGLEEEEMEL